MGLKRGIQKLPKNVEWVIILFYNTGNNRYNFPCKFHEECIFVLFLGA